MLAKLWKWLFGIAQSVFSIILKGVQGSVMDLLNSEECQQAALAAIKAVAENGLKDNEALDAAVAILKEQGIASGIEASNTVLRTLVQNAFCQFKCAGEE